MNKSSRLLPSLLIGAGIFIGLFALGYQLSHALLRFKEMNREVVVKGLAEQEHPASVAIWPLQFTAADNDIQQLTSQVQQKNADIISFLKKQGFDSKEI